MSIQQTLRKEIEDSKMWYDRTKEECIYKRDLKKRIELLNWTLDNLKKPDIDICALIEAKTNELVNKINEKNSTACKVILLSIAVIIYVYRKIYKIYRTMADGTKAN